LLGQQPNQLAGKRRRIDEKGNRAFVRHFHFLSITPIQRTFHFSMLTQSTFDFFIQWHLTERCNLRCRHCYQESYGGEELPLIEILRTIQNLSEMIDDWSDTYEIAFQRSFNVTGGEPFLRADLFDILAAMKDHGFDIYLLTNGILVDSVKAERLAALRIKGVQVSLEGPEEIHDAIRGRGSFRSSMEGLGYLVAAGVPVTLNLTLSRLNADLMVRMVELAKTAGAKRLGFSRLVPSGKGLGLLPEMLSGQEVETLYTQILSQKPEGLEIVTGDPLASQIAFSPFQENLGDIPLGGCAAGVSGLTILADGTVTPCRRLPLPIGNVRKESLRELWVASPVLEKLRDKSGYQGKCGRCPRWAACRGCRAIAYAYSRAQGRPDFLAEDPQCFL
jgi:radical SAM protein with 4Fe4S-binding SPASM domain